MSEIKNVD